jgi:hypothetical protein
MATTVANSSMIPENITVNDKVRKKGSRIDDVMKLRVEMI